jgi:predicted DCC family thiol-disulfide oxidoreductase YuxK
MMSDTETRVHAFEVFYDGGCPLCRREMKWLEKKDSKGLILFTDINDPDFDKSAVGKSHDELMAEIHGRTPDGKLVTGVEVFRNLYRTIGFRLPVAVSRWPLVRSILDIAYSIFARYRLRITRRCDERGCRQT